MKSTLNTIKLKSLSNEDLKELLIDSGDFVSDDLKNKSTAELITLVEGKAVDDKKLNSKLSKLEFSFKPSFYLTYIKDKSQYKKSRITKAKIELQIAKVNSEKNTEKYPSITGYQLFDIK